MFARRHSIFQLCGTGKKKAAESHAAGVGGAREAVALVGLGEYFALAILAPHFRHGGGAAARPRRGRLCAYYYTLDTSMFVTIRQRVYPVCTFNNCGRPTLPKMFPRIYRI